MKSEAETIADLALAGAAEPQVVTTDDNRAFLVTPEGHRVQEVTQANARVMVLPDVVRERPSIATAASLSAYLLRFMTPASVAFADVTRDRITAVVDYHNAAEVDAEAEAKPAERLPGAPNHTTHRAVLALRRSEEWALWSGIDGKLLDQVDFARFLEENGGDIAAPDGASVLEACRDLQAVRKVNFKRAVRTASGNESFSYSDETEARPSNGELELPTKFLLRIPVYFGESPTDLYAFLRWKLDDGRLLLGVKLHRAEHVRQAAFALIVNGIAEATGVPAFFGSVSETYGGED